MKALKADTQIKPKSPISSLSPFLDALNIVRVGGQLKNSGFSYEQCYPILLPSQHPFTKLLISYEHIKHLHTGPNLLWSILRRKFYILQQNRAIQTCIAKCVPCIHQKASTRTQIMASLPKARVTPARAFQNTGIDYAGPFKLLRKGGVRTKSLIQRYVGIFICIDHCSARMYGVIGPLHCCQHAELETVAYSPPLPSSIIEVTGYVILIRITQG